jgi:ATP-dependent Lhr-like helicase
VGGLARSVAAQPAARAERSLRALGLDERAARNLVAYVHEQREATGEVPSDRTVVVERFRDELGDYRVCVLSPFGARVHAPWALLVQARLRDEHFVEADPVWSDDGFVLRLPDGREDLPLDALLPEPETLEPQLIGVLGGTALFASRFREAAGRALLLPRRRSGRRTPLWAQRKRAADLLGVAARQPSFPIVLETMRECLREVLDVAGLRAVLEDIRAGAIAVRRADGDRPSPFAASILFSYVASFLYEGDAPLAERRAQALAIDAERLRELLGEADLRALLDPDAAEALARKLQWLDLAHPPRDADGLHDLLLALGDLSREEIDARARGRDGRAPGEAAGVERALEAVLDARRVIAVRIGGAPRLIAAEDAGRYRDAAGVMPPPGLPDAFLRPEPDALDRLLLRYARTHLPFVPEEPARRWGLGVAAVRAALDRLVAAGRLTAGAFLPGGSGVEYADADVLRALRRGSLARLRREVEAVPGEALARLLVQRHGLDRPRPGLDAVLDAVARLQGAPLVASALDRDVLPARVAGYTPAMLDALLSAGELAWAGLGALGPTDGRVALYLADDLPLLAPAPQPAPGELCARIRAVLLVRGASFFGEIVREVGAFPADVQRALWDMVWAGELTNDTLAPLRALVHGAGAVSPRPRRPAAPAFRSRRLAPPGTEGRWSLLPTARALAAAGLSCAALPGPPGVPVAPAGPAAPAPAPAVPAPAVPAVLSHARDTDRRAALARALLARHGVLTREAVRAEGHPGGFSAVYDVLRAMEEAGRVRRGYFVEGLGAAQFAEPGADDALRALRDGPGDGATDAPAPALVLAATDPANPYGAALPWPDGHDAAGGPRGAASSGVEGIEDSPPSSRDRVDSTAVDPRLRPMRAAGAHVVLWAGRLLAYLARGVESRAAGRGGRALRTFLPSAEPDRSRAARALASALAAQVHTGRLRSLLLATIDGAPATVGHGGAGLVAAALRDAGAVSTRAGLLLRPAARALDAEPNRGARPSRADDLGS